MDTYELLAQIEAGCRKDPKIPTRSSYRAAGELLMLRLRQEIFNTGVTFKTECRMMWDDAGRFIQQQIEAWMRGKKIESLSEIRGKMSILKSGHAATYERVNYVSILAKDDD